MTPIWDARSMVVREGWPLISIRINHICNKIQWIPTPNIHHPSVIKLLPAPNCYHYRNVKFTKMFIFIWCLFAILKWQRLLKENVNNDKNSPITRNQYPSSWWAGIIIPISDVVPLNVDWWPSMINKLRALSLPVCVPYLRTVHPVHIELFRGNGMA